MHRGPQLRVPLEVLILTEFFGQGDKEKELGLPVSMFMDRTTTNISSCQTGFIDVLVFPLCALRLCAERRWNP